MAGKEVITPVNTEARKGLGIQPGDMVRVTQKIQEKGKTRMQVFEGLVLTTKHGSEAGASFTVRKVASGVGVEKTFPLFSPMIDKIEIVKRTKVRQSKLYYIREKAAKVIRRSMRNAVLMGRTIESDTEEKERLAREAEEAQKQAEEEEKRAQEEAEKKAAAEAAAQEEASSDTTQEDATEEAADEAPTTTEEGSTDETEQPKDETETKEEDTAETEPEKKEEEPKKD